MISIKKRYTGVSLFEALLVLAIGASILTFSIGQYQSYRLDTDVAQLKYNADTLFQAMARYYKANCYGTTNPASGIVTPGTLNPNYAGFTDPFPVNIQDDLVNKGFLSTNLPAVLPMNPLVDDTGPGLNGYVAQFNEYASDRMICITTNASGDCTSQKKMGDIIIWKAQVAVLLKNSALAQQYLNLLGGDCLSDYDSAKQTVKPCSFASGGGGGGGGSGGSGGSSTAAGNYVVWERLPSSASINTKSDYWLANPTVQQFTQMYTTYPIVYLISPPNTGKIPGGQPQYILCGS